MCFGRERGWLRRKNITDEKLVSGSLMAEYGDLFQAQRFSFLILISSTNSPRGRSKPGRRVMDKSKTGEIKGIEKIGEMRETRSRRAERNSEDKE